MPPRKRKAPAAKAPAGGKKAKKAAAAVVVADDADDEDDDEPGTSSAVSDAIQKLKTADKGKIRKCKPDASCPVASYSTVSSSNCVI